jgi:2-oxoacid:acceptor oxidoreductase gamma subunit (pyruvate/2-ketoisovalerate family)/2-oxoacid:acceptor oxidoreductase delta subunit (pyruvate/2-ketoisovalerate family)
MLEIRFHGRGGQGAVTAAQTFAEAAISLGLEAQAFPYFGAERRGAPVQAYARVDHKPIRMRERITEPDVVVVFDETLLKLERVDDGLKPDGIVVLNTRTHPSQVVLDKESRCIAVDATSIALENLKAPIVNTAMLGAAVLAQDVLPLEAVLLAIKSRFGERLGQMAADANVRAAEQAYKESVEARSQKGLRIDAKAVWLPDWDDLPLGTWLTPDERSGQAIGPGSAWQNPTGTWRTSTPRYSKDKCVRCLRCWFCCPDACIHRTEDDHVRWDLRFCKGCGICASICPAAAIAMERGMGDG